MRIRESGNRSLWDLAVLSLLREQPMHPYEMQRLLRERHKDEVLVLKRGSLYHAIHRLLQSRLILAIDTSRQGRRPERTTYRVTPEGEAAQVRWLQEMIALPRPEPSEFMASVSFLVYLAPKDALRQLESRAQRLQEEVRGEEETIKALQPRLPRVHLLETEYLLAMRRAELAWVRSVVDDLRTDRLTWNLKRILQELQAGRKQRSTK
ncbi:MAG TPA: PadR family transcriptional regulator [Terriglobales bacterium]|nr:PadR family transcriptional regulator [Terriglobales bacterium]